MNFIDTHTHINDDALYVDRKDVISRAKEKGCLAIFNNGDSLESLSKIISIQNEFPNYCYSVLGIHPEFAIKDDDYHKASFDYVLEHIKEIKAIGEIGLDYHYEINDEIKERQKKIFIEWIRFAKRYNLPIVVHSRDAAKDTFDIIKEEKPSVVDLHCYSSSYELYKEYMKLPISFHIGIGGVVTFKNAKVLKEVVEKGEISSFLTETDAPYLAPTPFRGSRNESSYIPYIIKMIAELKNMNEEEVSEILLRNGKQFYGI